MTRWDFWAGQALSGLLAKESLVDDETGAIDYQWFAKAACRIATAMERWSPVDPTEHKKANINEG